MFQNVYKHSLTIVNIMDKFPCELVVWKVLPAIRKELSIYLVKKKRMKTKDVAKMLGITDAAVSQYIHKKRATEFALEKQLMPAIEELAEKIIAEEQKKRKMEYMKGSCSLCRQIRLAGMLCSIHKGSAKGCTICLGE